MKVHAMTTMSAKVSLTVICLMTMLYYISPRQSKSPMYNIKRNDLRVSDFIHQTFLNNNVQVGRFPQVLIIGAKKCGTGALKQFLTLNPRIVGSTHEVHFFDQYFDKGYDWYLSQLPKTSIHNMTFEGTPKYFIKAQIPKRVFQMNPLVKLILIFRHPVTRLISDYTHLLHHHSAYPSFEDLVFERNGEVNNSYKPVEVGKYSVHFKRWLRWFPRSQILILNGETFVTNPTSELNKVEDFLGLERVITESNFIFSESKGFICIKRSGSPLCMGRVKGRKHPNVTLDLKNKLKAFYAPYNQELYRLTGINFNWE